MSCPITSRPICEGVWQLTDVLDNRAYLVAGARRALLVDTMFGLGSLRDAVRALTDLPLTVVLTHRHFDHVGGTYEFGEVLLSELDCGYFGYERALGEQGFGALVDAGVIGPSEAWAPRDAAEPAVELVCEGDVFDLGGLTVEAVSLAGHTAGSMGYLVCERRLLLSGDAATPAMCLFFEESLSVGAWRATLEKMEGLSFDEFYTGHHELGFSRASLASFIACADAYETTRPMRWQHMMLSQFIGSLRVYDNGSGDELSFRGIITAELPPARHHGRRGRKAANGKGTS